MLSPLFTQSLVIKKWAVWAPELLPSANRQLASAVPVLIKRRCSQLSKMALEVSGEVLQNNSIDYAIFCSQHGELQRALHLLKTINVQELLSPAQFVSSVHNTAAGLFSIIHQLRQNMTSIAAGENTFFMGIIEAVAWLKLNPQSTVLLTVFDDHIPVEYQALTTQNHYQYAAAFLLTDRSQNDPSVSVTLKASSTDSPSKLPLALEFLNWLTKTNTNALIQNTQHQSMTWEKMNG